MTDHDSKLFRALRVLALYHVPGYQRVLLSRDPDMLLCVEVPDPGEMRDDHLLDIEAAGFEWDDSLHGWALAAELRGRNDGT